VLGLAGLGLEVNLVILGCWSVCTMRSEIFDIRYSVLGRYWAGNSKVKDRSELGLVVSHSFRLDFL